MPSEIKPNREDVENKFKEVFKDDFEKNDRILNELFEEHNKNDDFKRVLFKVVLLNTLYSTRVENIHVISMANHIMDIYKKPKYVDNPCLVVTDESRDHCLGLVKEIAEIEVYEKSKKDNKPMLVQRNFYSFASKFCFFQNPNFFFMYDSYVGELLWHFQKKLKYKDREFTRECLKNYETFYKAVEQFIDVFKLQKGFEKLTNRKIDIYLWWYGKKIKEEKKAQKEAEENKSNLE